MLQKFLMYCVLCIVPCVSARAVTCNVGEYMDGEFCRACPVNAKCDGTDFTCNDGWYKSGAICTKCSVENSTCTGADDYSCNIGFYDTGTACNVCPVNATCAGGHEWFRCDTGYYKQVQNGKEIACQSCVGHVCDGEEIIACAAGYYLHYSGICLECKYNYYCPAGTVGIHCMQGHYKGYGGVCYPCDEGYFCPYDVANINNMHDHCAVGYYKTGGACTKCDDGVVCPGGMITDMVCPDGLFLHDDGRCLTYAPGDCGNAPDCNPGCYNNNGICTKCSAEHSTCSDADNFSCVAGYYKNGNSCDICPADSTCPAGSEQISCIPGHYLNGKICSQCLKVHYCIDNVAHPCPEFSVDMLEPAPPAGHSVISANVYVEYEGQATNIEQCFIGGLLMTTANGEYVANGGHYKNGKYRIDYNTTSWTKAYVGYYLAGTAASWDGVKYRKSLPCTNGAENSHYTSAGTPDGNDCTWICDDGYYRDGNECKVCPEGMECLGGGIICPTGMYASNGMCVACPDGYKDNPNRGAQSEKECQIKCAGGAYIATSGATACENVGAGFWIAENFTNWGAVGTRNKCPTGLTTIGYGTGADEAGDCGYILRLGDRHKIYLRGNRKTRPTLNVLVGDTVYYGNMGVLSRKGLKVQLGDIIYTVYDDASVTE